LVTYVRAEVVGEVVPCDSEYEILLIVKGESSTLFRKVGN
jgi:hypothetical protein